MANEQIQSILACNRDVPFEPFNSKQDCSDIINISVFFDGTGNNKDIDAKTNNWSNVARLWFAAFNHPNPNKNNYPIYISGVGTQFNGAATDWCDQLRIDGEDAVGGSISGAGGSRRINFGHDNVNKALRQALFVNAKSLTPHTLAYSEKSKNRSMREFGKALDAHRLIKVINLSIFGFSRGAALARAFSNDFIRNCKTDASGRLIYLDNNRPIPIRIHFMGLFDTVASFGIPAANLDWPWAEKDLTISQHIERCVHYVAAHEIRFSFPVDLISKRGRLMPNWIEEVYPGSHSDVGGGYQPLSEKSKEVNDYASNQGITNNYARIPMRDMMREAVINGVRILSYGDFEKNSNLKAIFTRLYSLDQKTEVAYNNYMKVVPSQGSILERIDNHMRALYASYGTMTRKNIPTPDVRLAKDDVTNRLIGHVGMAREAEALQNPESAKKLLREESHAQSRVLQYFGTVYSQIVRPESWRLDAWNMHASDAILNFIQHYIHDSKAGFLGSVEPFSYFRPRGVFENSRNILADGMQWLDQKTGEVKESTIKIYYQAEKIVIETWKKGVLTATEKIEVGEQFVVDTVHTGEKIAVEVYQTSKYIVITTIDEGQKMVVSSVNTIQKTATEIGKELGDQQQRISKKMNEIVDAGLKEIEKKWRETKVALGLVK